MEFEAGGVNSQGGCTSARDFTPQSLEDLGHDGHIGDVGNISQSGGAFGQEGGGHQLEHGIFVTGDGDVTREGNSALDNILSHHRNIISFTKGFLSSG